VTDTCHPNSNQETTDTISSKEESWQQAVCTDQVSVDLWLQDLVERHKVFMVNLFTLVELTLSGLFFNSQPLLLPRLQEVHGTFRPM